MAVLGRLVRMARAWRAVASPKNVTHPRPCSPVLPRRFYHRSAEHQSHSNASEVLPHRSAPDAWRPYSTFPAILAGLFGVGVLDMAYSDGDEEIEFMKKGSLSPKELDALVSVLELAGGKLKQNKTLERKPREGNAMVPSAEKSVASLESMGVGIYGRNEARGYSSNSEISWDTIAGYDQQISKTQARLAEEIVALSKLKYTLLEELHAQDKELLRLKTEKMEYDQEREEKKIPQENKKLRLEAEKLEFARRETNESAERGRLEGELGIMTPFYIAFAVALLAILMALLATRAFLCLISRKSM